MKPPVARYIWTTHIGIPGGRLSKLGHWGNMPFPNAAAAKQFAHDDAGRELILEGEIIKWKA